jgi:RNA polymerase sigma-70 factor (ECF subfamily)
MKSTFSQRSDPPAYDDEADAAALAGIAAGDEKAFLRLHDRYRALLHAAIFRVLDDPGDTEEVLQEVFSLLWRKADQYRPERGRPITWLTSTARNRAIDRLRARRRQSRLKEAYEDSLDFVQRGMAPASAADVALRREACSAVRTAVLELNEIQREAIERVYFGGLTQQQLADEIGEPLGTVKARVRRGLAKLRETLDR